MFPRMPFVERRHFQKKESLLVEKVSEIKRKLSYKKRSET